jgi:lipid-A-disaccharide synthase-like uncharacterized protein
VVGLGTGLLNNPVSYICCGTIWALIGFVGLVVMGIAWLVAKRR